MRKLKSYFKVHIKTQILRIVQGTLKGNKLRGYIQPDINTYYKTIIIKTMWYWARTDKEANGTEWSIEIDSQIRDHLNYLCDTSA